MKDAQRNLRELLETLRITTVTEPISFIMALLSVDLSQFSGYYLDKKETPRNSEWRKQNKNAR